VRRGARTNKAKKGSKWNKVTPSSRFAKKSPGKKDASSQLGKKKEKIDKVRVINPTGKATNPKFERGVEETQTRKTKNFRKRGHRERKEKSPSGQKKLKLGRKKEVNARDYFTRKGGVSISILQKLKRKK